MTAAGLGMKGEWSREGTNPKPNCISQELPPALALKILLEHHRKMCIYSPAARPALLPVPYHHLRPVPSFPWQAAAGVSEPAKSGSSWSPYNHPCRAAPGLHQPSWGCRGLSTPKSRPDPAPAPLGSVKAKGFGWRAGRQRQRMHREHQGHPGLVLVAPGLLVHNSQVTLVSYVTLVS